MRTRILPAGTASLALAFLASEASAQSHWTKTVVSPSAVDASSVFSADVDGDGDLDALSAAQEQDTIAWHENLAGDGSSWITHLVSNAADGPNSVVAADVDGDGDLDALSTSYADNKVAWYENATGDGSSWIEHTISIEVPGSWLIAVRAADLDGDGDMDAFTADNFLGETLVWHENTAGDGTAWVRHTILRSCDDQLCRRVFEVLASDVDGDGDADLVAFVGRLFDVLSAELVWFENTVGDGSKWTEHSFNGVGHGAIPVLSAADVDGDGDPDFISCFGASEPPGTFWWENTTGNGTEWTLHVINDHWVNSVVAADVDRDGDIDTLSAVSGDDRVLWHENSSGDGSIWIEHEISVQTSQVRQLFAADVDGDGDLDPLSADSGADEIAWFENEVADPVGTRYCSPAVPNSTGEAAIISAVGSTVVADNDLTLRAAALPPNQFGYFLASETQGFVANPGGSAGNLCLGGKIARYRKQVQSSGDDGTFAMQVDLSSIPVDDPPQAVMPGDTWNFQAWFRDFGGASNFTDAIEIDFE